MVRRFLVVVVVAVGIVLGVTTATVLVIADLLAADRTPGDLLLATVLGVGLVLAAIGATVRAGRRWAAPLSDVMAAADHVATGDLTARVTPSGPVAVRRLAAAFNAMADRLASDEARRRDLLADLAHEIRTPLTGIRGTVEAILDGIRPPDADHLEVILERAATMDRLLDDLATLSSAEAGALELHREPTDPRRLVEDAVAGVAASAATRDVAVVADVAADLPLVEVDPTRIGQVLANLLTNALRHTPAGGRVSVRATAGGVDGRDGVVLTVTDTGSGIPAPELDRVFDRAVTSGGTARAGLGLTIARRLVEAHGGAIRMESAPGRGTTVEVVLPRDAHGATDPLR